MQRNEFESGFNILAAIPYSSSETIKLKSEPYYQALKYIDLVDWLECVDYEVNMDEHLIKGLKSPHEYFKLCCAIHDKKKPKVDYLEKPIHREAMIEFLNTCRRVADEKNSEVGGCTNLAGCFGVYSVSEEKKWNQVNERNKSLMAEEQAKINRE